MTEQNPLRVNRGIIQEFVPGKQVTMAHLIANPNEDLYAKARRRQQDLWSSGILMITPSEAAIIGADVATKAAGGGDRNLSIVFPAPGRCGDVAAGCGPCDVLRVLGEVLHFINLRYYKILMKNQDLVSWEESYFTGRNFLN